MSPKPKGRPKPSDLRQRTYGVAFNTKILPSYVHVIKVTMSEDIVEVDEQIRVDLVDDRDYPVLHAYCLANPPRKA